MYEFSIIRRYINKLWFPNINLQGLQNEEVGNAVLPGRDKTEETKIRTASFPSRHTILNGCRAGQIKFWQQKISCKTKHRFNYFFFWSKMLVTSMDRSYISFQKLPSRVIASDILWRTVLKPTD